MPYCWLPQYWSITSYWFSSWASARLWASQTNLTRPSACLPRPFVLTLASVCSYLTYEYLLAPLDLTYLRTLSFILVIAVVVQFTEMVVRKTSPLLHRVLGVYLPLITTNCAVLGVALLNINQAHNFMQSLIYGMGAALGFSVLVLFAAMRERLVVADVPEAFQGAAIGMITAGLASLAFMGFAGLV